MSAPNITFVNTGVTPLQPQTFYRFSKPEARPYIVVGPDPEHADFGPFTPGTKTGGIQEAINYAVATNRAIFIRNGVYYITAPFQIVPGSGGVFQSQIVVPANPNQPTTRLTIIAESYGLISEIAGNMSTQGVILYSKPPTYPTPTSPPYPFVWAFQQNAQMNATIKGLVIRQVGTTRQVNGMNMIGVNSWDVDVKIDIDQPIDTGAPATPPSPDLANPPTAAAFQTNNVSGQSGYNKLNIAIFGYAQGAVIASQTEVYNFYAAYTQYPIVRVGSLHPVLVHYANINNCPNFIGLTGSGYADITVEMVDLQDNLNTSYWFKLNSHIAYGFSVGPITDPPPSYVSGFIRYRRNPQGTTIPVNSPLIIAGTPPAQNYLRTETFDTPALTPSIAANPPASGTTYQNTNPYDIELIIPVTLNPTSSAAATATLTIGPTSSSLQTVDTETAPAGLTAGFVKALKARIPAGWYYQLTLTNATASTATVLPAP